MENEKIISIIDKLINADIAVEELEQIAPLLSTSDFKETFYFIENIQNAIKPIGRTELKNEMKIISKEYHNEMKITRIKTIRQWTLPAIAACFLIIVASSTYSIMQSHSNKNIYHSHSGGASSQQMNILK